MPTPSHHCEFPLRDLARRLVVPALGVGLAALLLRFAAVFDLLPAPTPRDLDRTILAAKVELAASDRPAEVVLLGDSSCMMNVNATGLGRLVDRPVLNLGTFSHLGPANHAELFRRFLRDRRTPPRDVLLLLHPGSLRRSSGEPEAERFLKARLEGRLADGATAPRSLVEACLGGVFVRERLVQPLLPQLLSGDFATAYGTTWRVRRRLETGAGSLVDPTRFDASALGGRYEFGVGAGVEPAFREFRSAIPPNVRLWVGLMPTPESLALPDHATRVRELRQALVGWLAPSRPLESVPAAWPDSRFATATHLNAGGVQELTGQLGGELASALLLEPR
ncbi:MAG: hypothetical protein JNL97_14615 [Verrucomicrobiales bacterium]|nr:hypothetical protein [Verrucomicrobiales bacterium]